MRKYLLIIIPLIAIVAILSSCIRYKTEQAVGASISYPDEYGYSVLVDPTWGIKLPAESKGMLIGSSATTTDSILEVNGNVAFMKEVYSYKMTAAPITYGGSCYDFNFDESASSENHYFLNDKAGFGFVAIDIDLEPVSLSSLDGTEDVGVVLCDTFGGALYLTIYFDNADFTDATDFDTWFEGVVDAGGSANTVNYYRESIFTAGGQNYTWANPDGVSLCSNATYVNPPTINGTLSSGFTYNLNDGNATSTGDFGNNGADGEDIFWWNGLMSIGANKTNPALPKEQIGFNLSKTFTSTANTATNIGGGFAPILQPTADTQSSLYGLFGSVQLSDQQFAGANFTGNYSSLNFTNFIDTTGDISAMGGALLGLTYFKNGGTLGVYKGIGFNIYDSAGGGVRDLSNLYFYEVPNMSNKGNWNIANNYGFYINDNTAYATNSWGIYNLDRSYFGGNVGIGTPTPGELLHIYGSDSVIRLQNPGGGGSYETYFENNYNASNSFTLRNGLYGNIISQHGYNTRVGNSDGHVGIGTSTPSSMLTINASAATGFLQIASSTNQNIMIVDKNGNVAIATSSMREKVNIEGNTYVYGRSRVTDIWHVYGGFQDETETLSINADTWTFVTNAGNDLWTGLEADGLTLSSDEMIVTNEGDYTGSLSITFEGANTKDYLFRIYNVTQATASGYHIGATGKGSDNYSNVSVPIYLEANAGDHFQFQVYQVNGNDAMFTNAIFNLYYLHE